MATEQDAGDLALQSFLAEWSVGHTASAAVAVDYLDVALGDLGGEV